METALSGVIAYNTTVDESYKNSFHKKLSYRRGTARHATLVNLCHFSRDVEARKVSNNKSDLEGHSRASTMVPFDRPHKL